MVTVGYLVAVTFVNGRHVRLGHVVFTVGSMVDLTSWHTSTVLTIVFVLHIVVSIIIVHRDLIMKVRGLNVIHFN